MQILKQLNCSAISLQITFQKKNLEISFVSHYLVLPCKLYYVEVMFSIMDEHDFAAVTHNLEKEFAKAYFMK